MSFLSGLANIGHVGRGLSEQLLKNNEDKRQAEELAMRREEADRRKSEWARQDETRAGLEQRSKDAELTYTPYTGKTTADRDFEMAGYQVSGDPNNFYDADSGKRALAAYNAPEAKNQRAAEYLTSRGEYAQANSAAQLALAPGQRKLQGLQIAGQEIEQKSKGLSLAKQEKIAAADAQVASFHAAPLAEQLKIITEAKLPFGATLTDDGQHFVVVDQKNPKKMKSFRVDSQEGREILAKGRELYEEEVFGGVDKEYAYKVRKERTDAAEKRADQALTQKKLDIMVANAGRRESPSQQQEAVILARATAIKNAADKPITMEQATRQAWQEYDRRGKSGAGESEMSASDYVKLKADVRAELEADPAFSKQPSAVQKQLVQRTLDSYGVRIKGANTRSNEAAGEDETETTKKLAAIAEKMAADKAKAEAAAGPLQRQPAPQTLAGRVGDITGQVVGGAYDYGPMTLMGRGIGNAAGAAYMGLRDPIRDFGVGLMAPRKN